MATRTAKATTKVERTADAANTQLVDYGSIATQLVGYGTIAQMMARPFEIWLRWQADMLKAAEPVTTGWLERRREGTEAALEAIEKLAACRDLSEAASIHSDWLDGAMKRLNSDIEVLTEQAMAMSREAFTASRNATQTSSEAHTSPPHRAAEREPQIEVRPVSP